MATDLVDVEAVVLKHVGVVTGSEHFAIVAGLESSLRP